MGNFEFGMGNEAAEGGNHPKTTPKSGDGKGAGKVFLQMTREFGNFAVKIYSHIHDTQV